MPRSKTKAPTGQRGQTGRSPSSGLSFGDRLRKARTNQGLTLRDLSSASDISIAYLSDLERGVLVNPTLDTLRSVAKALNVSLNDLLQIDQQEVRQVRYPKALEEFRALTPFREVVAQDAARTSRDPTTLEEEWMQTLASVQVSGRKPRTPSDYLFIFEAIRRAVDRR